MAAYKSIAKCLLSYWYLNTFLCFITRVIGILLFEFFFSLSVLKLSLSSIVIPSRTILWIFSILFPSKNRFILIAVFISNIMNWNLPGFGFNEFNSSYFVICPKSNLRICNIWPRIFPQKYVVLSSSKLHVSDFQTKKSISFIKRLNNKRLRIDPCGIQLVNSHQSLSWNLFLSFVFDYWDNLLANVN